MMKNADLDNPVILSVVMPCFNEAGTIAECLNRLLKIKDHNLELEIIIVDDCSTDNSFEIAQEFARDHSEVCILRHNKNQGKGAALRTGFKQATGNFVAIQDADLENDPNDLKKLLVPLINNEADVVFGSRFLTHGAHNVLNFWNYFRNKFLTIFSNMFTNLNLTDMETCYKVFRREIIQHLDLKENRFGIEPEMTAKIAQIRPRIYEVGISYNGRTYEEGKKIGLRDGIRTLYCILHYSAFKAHPLLQFLVYSTIEIMVFILNILMVMTLNLIEVDQTISISSANVFSAAINYILCIHLLFRHKARWGRVSELIVYAIFATVIGILDFGLTRYLLSFGNLLWVARALSCMCFMIPNFLYRRYIVFPEKTERDFAKIQSSVI